MFYWLGRVLGWILFWLIVKPMRALYGYRKIKILHEENLKKLQGKSVILIANHIKPRNRFLKLITIPYDAFMIRGVLKRYGIYTTALTSYDSGKKAKNAKLRKEQLTKGIVKSIDLIPLNRNEQDPQTLREFRKRIKRGHLGIGIYPEGTWFRGFRKKRKFHAGMVVLSKRYELPILPMYLEAYNLKKPFCLAIGNPLWEFEDSTEAVEHLRLEVIRLRELARSSIHN